jgi:hypothetical protein
MPGGGCQSSGLTSRNTHRTQFLEQNRQLRDGSVLNSQAQGGERE